MLLNDKQPCNMQKVPTPTKVSKRACAEGRAAVRERGAVVDGDHALAAHQIRLVYCHHTVGDHDAGLGVALSARAP